MATQQFQHLSIDQLCGHTYVCDCGKTHRVDTKRIVVEPGAMTKTPEILTNCGIHGRLLLVWDNNTYRVAGHTVESALQAAGWDFKTFNLGDTVHADELAIGRVLMATEDETGIDAIIAVGSGTLNDCVRYVAGRTGIPYVIIGTAPSMDGYASKMAPITIDRFKRTFLSTFPTAVIAEPKILAEAPDIMLAAGLGDVIGKVTALVDWVLGREILGETYCTQLVHMVSQALRTVSAAAEEVKNHDHHAAAQVMEALVLTGIAMQMNDDSRPASGCEHHLSHYWEIVHGIQGVDTPLHGNKVGVGTVLIQKMQRKMLELPADALYYKPMNAIQRTTWEKEVRRAFGPLGDEAIYEYDISVLQGDDPLGRLRKNWDALKAEMAGLMALSDAEAVLRTGNAPILPSDLGITRDMVRDALLYSKEVRGRYTVLRLAHDIGILDQWVDEVMAEPI